MNINIEKVPFSTAGSYLCVSKVVAAIWKPVNVTTEGLFIRSVREAQSSAALAGVEALDDLGNVLPTIIEATPWSLTLRSENENNGQITMAFDGPSRLRIAGTGMGLKLCLPELTYDEFMTYDENRTIVNSFPKNCRLLFWRLSGVIKLTESSDEAVPKWKAPKLVEMSGDNWELLIEEYDWAYEEKPVSRSFMQCVDAEKEAFINYLKLVGVEAFPEKYREAVKQAAYVNYSAQVGPDELLKGRVMLMSKNWMSRIWTWDCAFNAVEVSGYDAKSAWANFTSPFNIQHSSGMLPDAMNNRAVVSAYTKPPVHGWALRHLRAEGILDDEKRNWIYPRLLKWASSWYKTMDWDNDGMCQYSHGNDSGWDNCSYFKIGAPIEGPDLAAYLTICWDELACLATELGKPEEAKEHKARGDKQLNDLIRHSWDGEKFNVYQSGTHIYQDDCDSLLPFLPILLGDRLPKEIFNKLAAGLKEKGRFETPYGLATERVGGKHYISDGYWLGPIWAPPMMFVVEGLINGGEVEFGKLLAKRFCDNCVNNGFAENYDAETGADLRDRAYTWTSSVFLTLARKYLSE